MARLYFLQMQIPTATLRFSLDNLAILSTKTYQLIMVNVCKLLNLTNVFVTLFFIYCVGEDGYKVKCIFKVGAFNFWHYIDRILVNKVYYF